MRDRVNDELAGSWGGVRRLRLSVVGEKAAFTVSGVSSRTVIQPAEDSAGARVTDSGHVGEVM